MRLFKSLTVLSAAVHAGDKFQVTQIERQCLSVCKRNTNCQGKLAQMQESKEPPKCIKDCREKCIDQRKTAVIGLLGRSSAKTTKAQLRKKQNTELREEHREKLKAAQPPPMIKEFHKIRDRGDEVADAFLHCLKEKKETLGCDGRGPGEAWDCKRAMVSKCLDENNDYEGMTSHRLTQLIRRFRESEKRASQTRDELKAQAAAKASMQMDLDAEAVAVPVALEEKLEVNARGKVKVSSVKRMKTEQRDNIDTADVATDQQSAALAYIASMTEAEEVEGDADVREPLVQEETQEYPEAYYNEEGEEGEEEGEDEDASFEGVDFGNDSFDFGSFGDAAFDMQFDAVEGTEEAEDAEMEIVEEVEEAEEKQEEEEEQEEDEEEEPAPKKHHGHHHKGKDKGAKDKDQSKGKKSKESKSPRPALFTLQAKNNDHGEDKPKQATKTVHGKQEMKEKAQKNSGKLTEEEFINEMCRCRTSMEHFHVKNYLKNHGGPEYAHYEHHENSCKWCAYPSSKKCWQCQRHWQNASDEATTKEERERTELIEMSCFLYTRNVKQGKFHPMNGKKNDPCRRDAVHDGKFNPWQVEHAEAKKAFAKFHELRGDKN